MGLGEPQCCIEIGITGDRSDTWHSSSDGTSSLSGRSVCVVTTVGGELGRGTTKEYSIKLVCDVLADIQWLNGYDSLVIIDSKV